MLIDWIAKRGADVLSGRCQYPQEASPATVQSEGEVREGGRNGKLFVWFFALTANTIVTCQVYHSQIFSGFDLFPGPRGDTRLIAYLVEHWYQTLSGHATFLSPSMFYPVKGTLGHTDVLIAYIFPYSVLRMSGLDIFSALALAVISLNFLNFIFCFFLLHNVLRFRPLASCAGALFFAINNPKLVQAGHLQLQPLIFLLLAVIFVILFAQNTATLSQKRAFGLLSFAGAFLNLQLLTSFYIGWFFIFWSFLFFGLSFLVRRSRLYVLAIVKTYQPALTGAVFVFCLGFAFFLRIYLPAVWSTGWYGFSTDYIPEIKSYLLMADGNYIWGSWTAFLLHQESAGPDWGRRVGIGLVPSLTWIGLSIFAVSLVKKHSKMPGTTNAAIGHLGSAHTGYLFLALMILATNCVVILGLQYYGHSLWKFVYLFFPGARSIRAVARFVLVLALPMAIAFGFAVHCGMRRISEQKNILGRLCLTGAMLILIIFGVAEQFNSGEGQFSITAENARLERLAAKLPQNCASFYVAAGPDSNRNQSSFQNQNYMHDAMLVSILRGVPTLNGRSGKNPRGWSLRGVEAPEYEENVRRWIEQHRLDGNVCRLEIDE